ncbi:hypothetical protein NC653_022832 [Populus alba x Populus x berolinensis]|uniref:Uncharacterized protein n=1 Tax=Populus alba x Populus x berolinensis TaxID=444605 RepID=A0AAD6Q9W7_9ROSI|nr:hypothetical protein NC653_022832 [Populus alba x Populus x berolinensis]
MATTSTHRRHVLALAMLVIVGIHILGNQKVAAASCNETLSSLVSQIAPDSFKFQAQETYPPTPVVKR